MSLPIVSKQIYTAMQRLILLLLFCCTFSDWDCEAYKVPEPLNWIQIVNPDTGYPFILNPKLSLSASVNMGIYVVLLGGSFYDPRSEDPMSFERLLVKFASDNITFVDLRGLVVKKVFFVEYFPATVTVTASMSATLGVEEEMYQVLGSPCIKGCTKHSNTTTSEPTNTTPATRPKYKPHDFRIRPAQLASKMMGINSGVVLGNTIVTIGMCAMIPYTVRLKAYGEEFHGLDKYLRNVQIMEYLIPELNRTNTGSSNNDQSSFVTLTGSRNIKSTGDDSIGKERTQNNFNHVDASEQLPFRIQIPSSQIDDNAIYLSNEEITISDTMLKIPRFNATCIPFGNIIYIIGGIQLPKVGDRNLTLSSSIAWYDYTTNTFTDGVGMLNSPRMSSAGASDDSLLYISGGYTLAGDSNTNTDIGIDILLPPKVKLDTSLWTYNTVSSMGYTLPHTVVSVGHNPRLFVCNGTLIYTSESGKDITMTSLIKMKSVVTRMNSLGTFDASFVAFTTLSSYYLYLLGGMTDTGTFQGTVFSALLGPSENYPAVFEGFHYVYPNIPPIPTITPVPTKKPSTTKSTVETTTSTSSAHMLSPPSLLPKISVYPTTATTLPPIPDNDGIFSIRVNGYCPLWINLVFSLMFFRTPFVDNALNIVEGSVNTKPSKTPPLFEDICSNHTETRCRIGISLDYQCTSIIMKMDIIPNNTSFGGRYFPNSPNPYLPVTLVGPFLLRPNITVKEIDKENGSVEKFILPRSLIAGRLVYLCLSYKMQKLPVELCVAGKPCYSYFYQPISSFDPFLLIDINTYVPPVTPTKQPTHPPKPNKIPSGLTQQTVTYIIVGAVSVVCVSLILILILRGRRDQARFEASEHDQYLLKQSNTVTKNGSPGGHLLDGKYRVLQRLGKGSFSIVYLVERIDDGGKFALKYVLCADDLDRTEAIKECDVVHKLQGHPNVIMLVDMFMSYRFDSTGQNENVSSTDQPQKTNSNVYSDEYLRNPIYVDRGTNESEEQKRQHTANGERYLSLVMEYHEKGDVGKWVRDMRQRVQEQLKWLESSRKANSVPRKPFSGSLADASLLSTVISEGSVVSVAYQVLSVLNFMHMQSPPIIHRDLKPENLLMSSVVYDNVQQDEFLPVVVTDFGLSRVMDSAFCETGVGSLPYVAPECWQRHYSTKIDIWALGCILYGICTRRVAADNVKVMFADCNRPDFKESIRRDLCEFSTISTGLLTSSQLQMARRASEDQDPHRLPSMIDQNISADTMRFRGSSYSGYSQQHDCNVSAPLKLSLKCYSPQLSTFILAMLEPNADDRPTASQLLSGIKKSYHSNTCVKLKESRSFMDSIPNSIGSVFGKGSIPPKKGKCVFYIDPEFTEVKDDTRRDHDRGKNKVTDINIGGTRRDQSPEKRDDKTSLLPSYDKVKSTNTFHYGTSVN